MKISWKWLKELVDLDHAPGGPLTPVKLAEVLTSRGLEVEAIDRQAACFDKVVTAQIIEKKPHPQADRLSLCKVITAKGQATPLDIVCGAQNMKAGDKVVLAQVGSHLPNGMKIAQGKIRGEVSNGMLCSEEELGLKEKAEGILILPATAELGLPLAEFLGRDDTIFTLKLTANRSDCLSHWGMAREVASALGIKAKPPEALKLPASGCPIKVTLDAGESAPQFLGCWMDGVKVGPSPAWVVQRLEALGSRSINNVVDATNLLLFELGHPVHAYDGTRIKGEKIQVRLAKKDEALPLLDGQSVVLAGTELVIADAERAIGLAGVMGGGNSEVTAETTKVFLECAQFDPVLIRRASTKHQRRTEAAHRFERGIDPQALPHAIGRLAKLVSELAGGTVKGAVTVSMPSKANAALKDRKIAVDPNYFERFLGLSISAKDTEATLKALDCQVSIQKDSWLVIPPTYRLDLWSREDLAEEIARSIGYDKIPETIPTLSSAPVFAQSAIGEVKLIDRAKDLLVRAGFHEVMNYGFTSEAWLKKFGFNSSLPVLNPLSEEHAFLVPSLIPGLIRNALDNTSRHFGSEPLALRLFELRPTFHAAGKVEAATETETGIEERPKLAFLMSGPVYANALRGEQREIDFSDVKAVLDQLLGGLTARGVRMQAPSERNANSLTALFHPGKSMEVLAGSSYAGSIGFLHPGQAMGLKLRSPIWMGELDWKLVSKLSLPASASKTFKPWSEWPAIERDFALVVDPSVTAEKITQLALKAGKPLARTAKVFDVYKGAQVAAGKTSIAVRVVFADDTRSLQEAEALACSEKILASWQKDLGAELRG